MTALALDVRELSVDEMDEVSGGARAAAVAFLVGASAGAFIGAMIGGPAGGAVGFLAGGAAGVLIDAL
jgi:hypothetical protein